ncbi:MAG: hypothetical protein M5U19_22485 [Microthrixaceae bacterium]|nr:hypothetical protein [Microthrixaceae bacterium]
MVNKRMTGQIAGMAGAYGNVGAVIYLVVYSLVDARTFFFILAGVRRRASSSLRSCCGSPRVPMQRRWTMWWMFRSGPNRR